MILVLLGTFKIDFVRPIIALENAVLNQLIEKEIIVQAGYTSYSSKVLTIHTFIDSDQLNKLYQKAEIIITHGGVGSILKGFELNKKMIAIPRLLKYKEHVDDHQLDILEEFAASNYLIVWNEHDKIEDLIEKAKGFMPSTFVSNKKDLSEYLINYIDNI